jgi:hypothetical protein
MLWEIKVILIMTKEYIIYEYDGWIYVLEENPEDGEVITKLYAQYE